MFFSKCTRLIFNVNLFSDTWEVLNPMTQERAFAGCVVLPNTDNILLVGSWSKGDV
jgi:hypothetical protein